MVPRPLQKQGDDSKTPLCPQYVCVCDYTTKKYKKKICYHQKKNSDVKTFERPKNIKES